MIIYVPEEKHKYIMVFDIEFDQDKLVEFAALWFESIGDHIYQLSKSINQYIYQDINYNFIYYTGITSKFLEENGIKLTDLYNLLDDFIGLDIDPKDLLIVSHGLKGDLMVLKDNGIDLTKYDKYCTYKNARKLLNRSSHLKVSDIAEECGYYLDGAHNAYHDVWAHVSILCYLKKKEFEISEKTED